MAVLLALATVAAACSGGDGDGGDGEAAPAPSGEPLPSAGTADGATSSVTVGTSAPATSGPSATTLPPVPETGVPGLDSDDAVCRSWSRFAGSFQAVAVAAAFGDPAAATQLEVLAAPTVTDAYDELLAAWPAELAGERDAVADGYLGPFARRAQAALDALEAAGAGPEETDVIMTAWEEALARRDPSTPELAVTVPDDVGALVEEAAAGLPAFGDDPTLRLAVSVPDTEAYLAANCPDRGTLSGTGG